MASTTTYGDFPGVKISTAGGAITGVAVGREQKLVVVGVGDGGSATTNEPVQIDSRLDADRKFGEGSELAEAIKDALANGANIDFLYGVKLATEQVSAETFTTTDSGTLANAPIVEDLSTITVTADGTTADVSFRYDSPPTAPSDTDTVFIDPLTGDWTGDASADYEFTYEYPNWADGLSAAAGVVEQEETAIIAALTEAESVATDLSAQVNTLRGEYKLALGLQAAEPNTTTSDDAAGYDTTAYTDSIDNDAIFLHAPARKDGEPDTITGAIGGVMAGNALNDSIYRDAVTVDDLEQRLSQSEADDLRDEQVIPVQQPPSGGSVVIGDNRSTSTETDWERDYWRRRIVDQVILIAKAIGDSIIGRINDDDTRETVETALQVELRGLADDRLIEQNTSTETNWFVDVYEIDADTVGIDLGVRPYGIVKRVDTTVQIST